MNTWKQDIGIDLGTANSLVHVKGRGIIIREPSVVAVDKFTKEVLAVGNEAKLMIGRTPANIIAVRPLKDGVISDFDMTQAMLKSFIKKAQVKLSFFKPRVIICVPSGVTQVEKRAVEEATMQAGARDAYLIEEPVAAAIGARMPITDAIGSMVVDIGGGSADVAVMSLGGSVAGRSIRVAGDKFDEAIIQYVRKSFNVTIGERTAEDIKIKIGSVSPLKYETTMEINGRDSFEGLPKKVDLSSIEMRKVLLEPAMKIVNAIRQTLEETPPELAADIIDTGIVLTGGGALIRGLDKLIEKEVKMPVRIAENPLECVVIGTGRVIDEIEHMHSILMKRKR